jgi:CubicO group peptidase (beta-lactamase class C family)
MAALASISYATAFAKTFLDLASSVLAGKMHRIFLGFAALCMACCFCPGATVTANAQELARDAPVRKGGKNDDLFADVRRKIQREMAESGMLSFAVAVARNGEIVWKEAFGWADLQRRIPATVHTMYSLASVSKPITATGLMVLLERRMER